MNGKTNKLQNNGRYGTMEELFIVNTINQINNN